MYLNPWSTQQHNWLSGRFCHSAQKLLADTSGPLSEECRRWQTDCHLDSQWCWGQKGVTFHKKTPVPRDPWLALLRESFIHRTRAVKRCSWILQTGSQEPRSQIWKASDHKCIWNLITCNHTYSRRSLIYPSSAVLSSSQSYFSCFLSHVNMKRHQSLGNFMALQS